MRDSGARGAPLRQPLLDRIRARLPEQIKARAFATLADNPALRHLALGSDGIVASRGLRFDLRGGHERHAASLLVGLYERGERYMATHFYDGTRDVVELGASIGVISCELARRRAAGVRQISVEAEPTLAARARRNLELNGFGDVVVEQFAIDYSGAQTVRFAAGRGLSGRVSDDGNVEVRTRTLSQLLEKHAITCFDLVMDIEGAEDAVLAQEGEALQNCRRILLEAGEHLLGPEGAPPVLAELGFRQIYRHDLCAAFERAP